MRAAIAGQHNMSEEGVLEHPTLRREFAVRGIAGVWIAPPSATVSGFSAGAGKRFEKILREPATVSGCDELSFAPVIPIGHSACASYPWNFAAWNPARTLAGVPGLLMTMADCEWLEGRLAPGLAYRVAHPAAPRAMLAEPGRGTSVCRTMRSIFSRDSSGKPCTPRLPADAPADRRGRSFPAGACAG